MGRLIPVASLDRDTRRRIGDCDLVGSDPETTLRARDNLDCDRTLLRAGDSFSWYCGLFRLWPTQGQSSPLGVGSADPVSGDEYNPLDTNHCSRGPQLAHNIGALLRR